MSGSLSDKLQKLQNRAARVITQSPFDTSAKKLPSLLFCPEWPRFVLFVPQKAFLSCVVAFLSRVVSFLSFA